MWFCLGSTVCGPLFKSGLRVVVFIVAESFPLLSVAKANQQGSSFFSYADCKLNRAFPSFS